MSEVREQPSHVAIVGLQRGQILERVRFPGFGVGLCWLWLHAEYVRMPLVISVAQTSVCGVL
jgi:hypothetical protein